MPKTDIWADWVLERQFGPNPATRAAGLAAVRGMAEVRDHVLDNAALVERMTVLDMGCGSGPIGFGAAERVARDAIRIAGDR